MARTEDIKESYNEKVKDNVLHEENEYEEEFENSKVEP